MQRRQSRGLLYASSTVNNVIYQSLNDIVFIYVCDLNAKTRSPKLLNIRYTFFYKYTIVANWNSLPGRVVDVNSINIFKNRLDNHWFMQDVMYDFESELTRIGNRSFE